MQCRPHLHLPVNSARQRRYTMQLHLQSQPASKSCQTCMQPNALLRLNRRPRCALRMPMLNRTWPKRPAICHTMTRPATRQHCWASAGLFNLLVAKQSRLANLPSPSEPSQSLHQKGQVCSTSQSCLQCRWLTFIDHLRWQRCHLSGYQPPSELLLSPM